MLQIFSNIFLLWYYCISAIILFLQAIFWDRLGYDNHNTRTNFSFMTKQKNLFILISVVLLTGLLQLSSCRDDDFNTSPSLTLEFSMDSLLFDTVFTTVGSSTRYFKAYNRHNSRIRIPSIQLGSGASGYFRINADGKSGSVIRDVEIGPKDSLYVFVEVTVDALDHDLPLIITDSVIFDVNSNLQDVKLVAWGQDAHFIYPNDTLHDIDLAYHLISENTVWAGPKPYVVYGIVLVAPGASLHIEPGTQVHFHHQSALIFSGHSSLKVQGTLEEPVTFQGDRLEADYRDLPGQWGYIWLTASSRDHEIDYAIIKNATYGIVLDSIGSFTEPTLRIRNSIIKNMDQTALEFRGSHVEAENLVIANCGKHAIYLGLGGNYDFRHITIGNYYNLPGTIRQTPSLMLNNYYIDTTHTVQVRDFEKVYFGNSIIYGSLQEEIQTDIEGSASFSAFSFDHSLLRTSLHHQMGELFTGSIFNQSPRFVSTSNNDYRLREDSPAIDQGDPQISVPYDILGHSRQERIDLGAYQYYEIEEDEKETD